MFVFFFELFLEMESEISMWQSSKTLGFVDNPHFPEIYKSVRDKIVLETLQECLLILSWSFQKPQDIPKDDLVIQKKCSHLWLKNRLAGIEICSENHYFSRIKGTQILKLTSKNLFRGNKQKSKKKFM